MLKWLKNDIWIKGYLLVYSVVLIVFSMMFGVDSHWGEWDDYSLAAISIINEQDFGISQSDIAKAKEWFPKWSEDIDHYELSGYYDKSGGQELAWYFPTYSIVCIPFLLLLRVANLPAEYAFRMTNAAVMIYMLFFVYRNCRLKKRWKWLLLFLLSASPIVMYIPYVSAEVFLYAFLVMGSICWVNREFCKAGLFVSVAGTLNPVIMFVGIVMIIDFLGYYYVQWKCVGMSGIRVFLNNWKKIFRYACCFVPGIVPMIYNYYEIGHINLTASMDSFLQSKTTTLQRFWAYLTDLNFGILPYYGILFIVGCVVFVLSLLQKKYRFCGMMVAFLGVMYLYSIMVHINSGMSGIARYNGWNVAILIVMTIYGTSELIDKKYIGIGICVGNVAALCVIGFLLVKKVNYMYMGPVAQVVLNHCPALYNPLPSTFNSRINHIDGGYDYVLPLYYQDENEEIRKILVSDKCVENVKKELVGSKEDMEWLDNRLQNIKGEQYISVESNRHLKKKE